MSKEQKISPAAFCFLEGVQAERQRIIAIVKEGDWQEYGDDYYQTHDAGKSEANLIARIEGRQP